MGGEEKNKKFLLKAFKKKKREEGTRLLQAYKYRKCGVIFGDEHKTAEMLSLVWAVPVPV